MKTLLELERSISERALGAAELAHARYDDQHCFDPAGALRRKLRHAIAVYQYELQLSASRINHAKPGETANVDAGQVTS